MKKIIFFGIMMLLFIPKCFAENLNFRTNVLMFYEYSVNGQTNYFTIYTDNITNNLLYTTSPLELPQYQTDYQKSFYEWENIDFNTQNKIKNYISKTQNESEFAHQMFYYMNTQLLIWETFHPELTITVLKNENQLIDYKTAMEENWNITPSWIHDYEVSDVLIIEKQESLKLSSDSCKIQEDEKNWIITCFDQGIINVAETEEEKINYYNKENHLSIISSGQNAQKWSFQVRKKDESKAEISTNENDSSISKKDQTISNHKQSIKIENVPNTREKNIISYYFYTLMLFFFIKKR